MTLRALYKHFNTEEPQFHESISTEPSITFATKKKKKPKKPGKNHCIEHPLNSCPANCACFLLYSPLLFDKKLFSMPDECRKDKPTHFFQTKLLCRNNTN